jgi:hypothetical protein
VIKRAILIELGRADDQPADDLLSRIRAGLAERVLDHVVQVGDDQRLRQRKTPPEGRGDSLYGDFDMLEELVRIISHEGDRAGF